MAISRPARLVAPLVLLLCAAAVLVVVQNTLSEDGSTTPSSGASTATTTTTSTNRRPRTYRVRSGDTLGGIAERVDVPVDRILELNPKVDPQSLRAGQRLKLRE